MKTPKTLRLIFSLTCLTLTIGLNSVQAKNNTPPTDVPLAKAINDAQKVAALKTRWEVMLADGDSMSPHYGECSVLVVDKLPYRQLREGMVAIYRDSKGDLVGHLVLKKETDGWVMQGANNDNPDSDLMTKDNYVGILFGVLNSAGDDSAGLHLAETLKLPTVIGKRN